MVRQGRRGQPGIRFSSGGPISLDPCSIIFLFTVILPSYEFDSIKIKTAFGRGMVGMGWGGCKLKPSCFVGIVPIKISSQQRRIEIIKK
jgi:hypothetical protein